MIQFSKPRKPLDRNAASNRFEHSARDLLDGANGNDGRSFSSSFTELRLRELQSTGSHGNGVPSRFDSSFFRTHDAISHIPSDAQSVRSQATYSSGLPTFSQAGGYPSSVKRGTTSSYASSTFSQDLTSGTDSSSVRDDASSVAGGTASSIAYSQADRLRRGSLSASDADYKSQEGNWRDDDDASSQFSASGVTEY